MKIEETEIFGFRAAIRGMRNARESWANSDSEFWSESPYARQPRLWPDHISAPELPFLGSKDLQRMRALCYGPPERKFLRMICIWFDLTLPRYIWAEFDTYKVGTVKNSCSTMDNTGKRDLTIYDFQDEDVMPEVLEKLNSIGRLMRNREGKTNPVNKLRREYKRKLPEGYLLKATILMNYEVARSMYFWRKDHRMEEWNIKEDNLLDSICKWLETLPYANPLITYSGEE
jgi:hypothetical protein